MIDACVRVQASATMCVRRVLARRRRRVIQRLMRRMFADHDERATGVLGARATMPHTARRASASAAHADDDATRVCDVWMYLCNAAMKATNFFDSAVFDKSAAMLCGDVGARHVYLWEEEL